MNIIEQISSVGIIPVVKIDNVADALPLAKALCDGGIAAAEITFRTDAAEQAIREICREYPNMVVGAGTVLTTEQADAAIKAGAKFIVSPGLNPTVVKYCTEKGYPIVPGVSTASEIECGLSLGLKYLKFFPAEPAGGVKMIKALSAPYGMVKFMPTGGINTENVRNYLNCNAVFACGGSWMVSADMIKNGEFDKIKELTAKAAEIVKEIKK